MTVTLPVPDLWEVKAILEGKAKQVIRPSSGRKPRIRTGNEARFLYKQKAAGNKWFCYECGKSAVLVGNKKDCILKPVYCKSCSPKTSAKKSKGVFIQAGFPNNFATFKISDIFDVKIGIKGLWWKEKSLSLPHSFAKKGGYKSARDMFDSVHKKHNIEIPKKFVVYRW